MFAETDAGWVGGIGVAINSLAPRSHSTLSCWRLVSWYHGTWSSMCPLTQKGCTLTPFGRDFLISCTSWMRSCYFSELLVSQLSSVAIVNADFPSQAQTASPCITLWYLQIAAISPWMAAIPASSALNVELSDCLPGTCPVMITP